jgi:hypothetical protein
MPAHDTDGGVQMLKSPVGALSAGGCSGPLTRPARGRLAAETCLR